ncbi:hypothetical protein U8607_14470 [Methylobacterium durans]|uniref:hypothetical protein n=1 Tax=Methylobacterium durans TaxID=2202825 RepID=UPI002AFF2AB4|nr:hypothetical protein [Methylobacterium durans]MEA1833286.1 hypothetical protein [Methylobacterium durans]
MRLLMGMFLILAALGGAAGFSLPTKAAPLPVVARVADTGEGALVTEARWRHRRHWHRHHYRRHHGWRRHHYRRHWGWRRHHYRRHYHRRHWGYRPYHHRAYGWRPFY